MHKIYDIVTNLRNSCTILHIKIKLKTTKLVAIAPMSLLAQGIALLK